ncbi:hypothetical protein MANES_18G073581v8 [Manihot esculenta]|uniref:Uncharacterized protein n=1 Tax=Manihot esculenta TaxID=3983 RepID=A0ACB7FZV9_MANES|nr:hypothetical protein MANES_18G073581v8 [Manihot esculenta]
MEEGGPELRLFDSSEELSSGLADYVHQISESAIKERGSFSLVLCGGDVPKRLGKLTSSAFLKMVEWSKWHVFWAEENVVAKRHPDSLFWQAKEYFLSKVPILPAHIVPVSHDLPGESAANSYEFSIRQHVRKRTVSVSPSSDCPRFDLILLNFPLSHQPVPGEDTQWVSCVSNHGSKERVILTLPVINAAAHVAIVASGPEVAPQFLDMMMGNKSIESSPARIVQPLDGKLVWFVDATAASLFLRGKGCAATSGHTSASSPSDKPKENLENPTPAHGSNQADSSNYDGGWKYNCGCGLAPDGSWSYNWGTGSGPDGSNFGFGSGSGRSPDGGSAGYGFGFGSSGSGGGSSESYGVGTGYGCGSNGGIVSNGKPVRNL